VNAMESFSSYTRLVSDMEEKEYSRNKIHAVISLLDELKARNVENSEGLETQLTKKVSQREGFWDIWSEGKAALILASNGFRVTIYPCGPGGVDLEAFWQHTRFFVEVSRFREDDETSDKLAEGEAIDGEELLVNYGRGEKDVEAVHSKIVDKVTQLPEGDIGLVFLSSDNVRIEDIEFKQAVRYLEEQVIENRTCTRLSGVLFDRGWVRWCDGQPKRFYLWCNPSSDRPIDGALHNKLCELCFTV